MTLMMVACLWVESARAECPSRRRDDDLREGAGDDADLSVALYGVKLCCTPGASCDGVYDCEHYRNACRSAAGKVDAHQHDRHNNQPFLADIQSGWQGKAYSVQDASIFEQIDNIYSCESSDADALERMETNRDRIKEQHYAIAREWRRWFEWAAIVCTQEPASVGGGDYDDGGGDNDNGGSYDDGGGDNDNGGGSYDDGGGDPGGATDSTADSGDYYYGGYSTPTMYPSVNTGPPVSTYYRGLASLEVMYGWGLQLMSLQSIDATYWNLSDATLNVFWPWKNRGVELSFRFLFGVHREEEWTGTDALLDLSTSLRTFWRWGGIGVLAEGKLMNFHESFRDEVGDRFRLAPEVFATLGGLNRKWSNLVAILRWDLAQDFNPFGWVVLEGRYFLFYGRFERQLGVDGDGTINMISFGLRLAAD